jgi:hypothetical protein
MFHLRLLFITVELTNIGRLMAGASHGSRRAVVVSGRLARGLFQHERHNRISEDEHSGQVTAVHMRNNEQL